MSFAERYQRFRTSGAFLAGFAATIALYIPLNLWLGFDPGFTQANFGLSIEASLMGGVTVAIADAINRKLERMLAHIEAAAEQTQALAEQTEALAERILAGVAAIERRLPGA